MLGLSIVLPSLQVSNAWAAGVFIVVLTLLNLIVLPIIKILTLPINFLTLGIFNVILNLFVVIVVAGSIKGMDLGRDLGQQVFTAFIIVLSLSIGNSLINTFEKD